MERDARIGDMLERLDRLLQVARWLSGPPDLPPRDESLWGQALETARAQLSDDLEKSSRRVTTPPGRTPRTSTPGKQRRVEEQADRAVERRAEAIYDDLDASYSEAKEAFAQSVDEHIRQFDVLRTPVRSYIQQLDIGQLHWALSRDLPVCDYRGEMALSQPEWHALWQREAPAIVHDLERVREATEHQMATQDASQLAGPPGKDAVVDTDHWLWRLRSVEDDLARWIPDSDVYVAFAVAPSGTIDLGIGEDLLEGGVSAASGRPAPGWIDDEGGLWFDLGWPAFSFTLHWDSLEGWSLHDRLPPEAFKPVGDGIMAHTNFDWCTWCYVKPEEPPIGAEPGILLSSRLADIEEAILGCCHRPPRAVLEDLGDLSQLGSWALALYYMAQRKVHPLLMASDTYLADRKAGKPPDPRARIIYLSPDYRTATLYAFDAFREIVASAAGPSLRAPTADEAGPADEYAPDNVPSAYDSLRGFPKLFEIVKCMWDRERPVEEGELRDVVWPDYVPTSISPYLSRINKFTPALPWTLHKEGRFVVKRPREASENRKPRSKG